MTGVVHGAVARRAEVVAAGLAPKLGDQLLHVRGRQVRARDEEQRDVADHRRGGQVGRADRGVREQRRRDAERGGRGDHHRVAVGRGARHLLARDQRSGAGPVLDDHRLTEREAVALGDGAPERIGGRAGREGHEHADRAVGPRGLCAGAGGERGRAEGGRGLQQRATGGHHPRSNSRIGRRPGFAGTTPWPLGRGATPSSGTYSPLTAITGSPATVTRSIVRRCGKQSWGASWWAERLSQMMIVCGAHFTRSGYSGIVAREYRSSRTIRLSSS